MTEGKKLSTESWLSFFRRTGHFGDFILLAWSGIETNLDVVFLASFNILPNIVEVDGVEWPRFEEDKRAKLLLDFTFNRKMEFLQQTGDIEQNEMVILKKFRRDRNRFFHGREPPFIHLNEKQRDEVMDTAGKAEKVSFDIAYRSMSKYLRRYQRRISELTPYLRYQNSARQQPKLDRRKERTRT